MAGSSTATISGMRLCNSSNSTRISRRARLAPRQKCAPPAAVPDVRVGISGDVEQPRIAELRFVAVGRVVPHRDLVAGLHLDAAQFDVLGEIAAHEDHRRAQRTISSTAVAATPSKSAHHLSPLLGIAAERHHAVADRVAGGLVAGGRQQDEERGDLRGRQPLAVDLGLHQVRGQILPGSRPPSSANCTPYAASSVTALTPRRITGRLVVSGSQDHRRPVEDLLLVLLRDAHHVADDLQRQRTGDLATKSAARRDGGPPWRHESARGSRTLSSMRATTLGVNAF